MSQNQIYFLHIPKTAGTSFRAFLEDHFDLAEICPHWLLQDILKEPPSKMKQYNLVCGHFGRYILPYLSRNLKIVTMLRDPVDRTISHYFHIKNDKNNWLNEVVSEMSLDEFLCHPIGISEVMNSQTSWLAFDQLQEQHFKFSHSRRTDPSELIDALQNRHLFDKAKQMIDELAFVGLLERFDDSVALLCHQFGWPISQSYKFNVAPKRIGKKEISEHTMNRIKELTQFDQEIYNYAADLFEERFSKLSEEEVEQAYALTMKCKQQKSQVFLGFEKGINGSGWLNREVMPNGDVYRWTGPGTTATLDFPLQTENYYICFYAGVYCPEMLEHVKLEVNGISVPLQFHYVNENINAEGIFNGMISKEIVMKKEGYTRFEFSINQTIRPIDLDPLSGDTRTLGIYFKWLDLGIAIK